MAAPVVDSVLAGSDAGVDESAVWDVYRALCGALMYSDRTEVWALLADPDLRLNQGGVEDQLFRASAFLIAALRAEAAGGSPAAELRQAHDLIRGAIKESEVCLW